MRRLTDFEKGIVTKIYEAEFDGIEFERIVWFKEAQDFIIKVGLVALAEEEAFQINLYTKAISDPSHPSSIDIIRRYYREFKKFYDALNLIHLLQENGLIYLDSSFFPRFTNHFPFVRESNIVQSDLNGIILEENGNKEIFHNINSKEISEKDVDLLLNTIYQPTAALEIYVQNGFRTEEQKLADEALAHNKRTTIISWVATSIAIIGVLVSGYYSAKSYYQSQADENKNDSFKKEVMIQVDEMAETIKGIRKDLKPASTIPVKKP